MPNDLLLPMTSTAGDADALAAGIALADAFGARLTVLEMVSLPKLVGNPWDLSPDLALVDTYKRLRAQAEINVDRLKARLDGGAVANEVRLVEAAFAAPERVAAHHAHYADLCLVAGPDAGVDGELARAYFSALLLGSGRPVLMVPPGSRAQLPAHRVVVAWRPSRESARAIHDALPLLKLADHVDVLVVDAAGGELSHGEEPGSDVAAHLAREGVKVNVVRRDSGSRPVGSILLEHARETLAQMIVAGGYGHSRLREWALGGVTRELLMSAPIPVLFSH
ncbi:universal stress protein [Dokdonella immobilis]|uniref:Nucleotide-binding universal stress protein, UspA family n=1 Tax=Dokdonella immobilis TaxID=578942 RepID=A0A1I4ZAT6_9GAMM|nr:universal stress protein [Dokdonella immobilis]SFN47391.1 Nucleotide-binding universal stress protein, UspA family [Dokdonella immobilis]